MTVQGDETIVIIRRTADDVDDYGNTAFTTERITVTNALVAFGATGEPNQVDREPIDGSLTIYLPHGTQIDPGDVFEVRGELFEKDGDPQVWSNVFAGFVPGVVVNVRRRRG